jgi:hypothetical protein
MAPIDIYECLHTKRTRGGSSCSKQGKSEGPVLSDQAAVRETVGSECPSPGQVASDQGEGQDPRQLKELWRRLVDLIEENEKESKTREKYEKNKFD